MLSKLSVAVMAHPSRTKWAEALAAKVGAEGIAWEAGEGRWDTGRRAWQMYAPDATHHLVLQDDALVSKDLVSGVEAALGCIPAHRLLVSLFYGQPHTGAQALEAKTRAMERAVETNASWIILRSLNWGLGIVLPTAAVPAMVSWCDRQTVPAYDLRIGLYCRDVLGWKCWYTWPSLVEHRVSRSLCGHEHVRAYRFHRGSAQKLDWTGPVVGRDV